MAIVIQFALAGLLIAAATIWMLLWLLLIVLSYSGQSGLMPWTAAAVILYGLVFVAISAIPGVPGILWINHLANRVSPKWRMIVKIPGWIGTTTLVLGFVVAIALLVREHFRERSPYDGCVSYRDAATSSALAASGAARGIDCPTKE